MSYYCLIGYNRYQWHYLCDYNCEKDMIEDIQKYQQALANHELGFSRLAFVKMDDKSNQELQKFDWSYSFIDEEGTLIVSRVPRSQFKKTRNWKKRQPKLTERGYKNLVDAMNFIPNGEVVLVNYLPVFYNNALTYQ